MVPVIIGALGSVTNNFKTFMGQIGIELEIHFVQNHIIRNSQDIEESIRVLCRNRTRNLWLLVIISFPALHIDLPSTSDLKKSCKIKIIVIITFMYCKFNNKNDLLNIRCCYYYYYYYYY